MRCGQGGLYPVHNPRAFPHQAVALAVWPLGVLFGNCWHARHAAMAPFSTQRPQEPPLQQLGVETVGLRPAMLPRYRETGGMDHVRLDATRLKPARQPEAVPAGFEGKRNPRDRGAGPDRLIPPAMQKSKQPFWARLQLFARLTLNARNDAANQPARLAQLDHGNDRAILVQGGEGSAQVVQLGHRGTPSLDAATKLPFLAARPIASIGRAEKETALERGPAADHLRLARRRVLNDPIQLIGPASLVGKSRETFHKSGTDGSNPVPSSEESQTFGSSAAFGQLRGRLAWFVWIRCGSLAVNLQSGAP